MAHLHKQLSNTIFTERNKKELKYVKIYDQYRRDYLKEVTITPKFYSLHDTRVRPTDEEAVEEIINNINIARDVGPRFKRKWPETTNQTYGWWPEPLVKLDRDDPRFYFPKSENEITKFGIKALQCRKGR